MKFKVNSEGLLTVGLIGGLAAAAWLWWQSVQDGGLRITKIKPGDYSFLNAPGGTIVGDVYVPVGGANIRPLPATLTPNTNPAGT